MASVNKVILVGNLGRDPEVRYTPDGAAITLLAVATTSSWKDRNSGERRDETEWHRVVIYGRLAEVAGEYLRKGRPVYVEGRIKTRKWQDKDTGQDRYATEIIGEQMQMLGGRDETDDGGFSSPPPAANNQQPKTTQRSRPATPPSFADMDDDLPF